MFYNSDFKHEIKLPGLPWKTKCPEEEPTMSQEKDPRKTSEKKCPKLRKRNLNVNFGLYCKLYSHRVEGVSGQKRVNFLS